MEKINFFDNGKYEIFNEINGVKQGKSTYYWGKNTNLLKSHQDYGKIKEEFTYIDGIKQGKAITYFDSENTNKIKEEFYYINDIKQGESILLYLDRLEKRYYTNGKLKEKVLVYRINGKAEVKKYNDTSFEVKEKFKTLKEILGINETQETEKMEKLEYDALKLEAEKSFNETANFYRDFKEKENIIPFLFIEKYYLKYKNLKFGKGVK